jgi:LPXTG-site transpeptidase (sortase) family protein
MTKTARRSLERFLLIVGLVCCGIWLYAWADARWFEMRESRRLEQALASPEQASVPSAAESFDSFRRPGGTGAGAPPAPREEGELIGRVELPRLGIEALLLEGIAAQTLRRGVGHIPGTPLPSDGGNVGLAGHRDSYFRALKDVKQGDVVDLKTLNGTWSYRVAWTRIVLPSEVDVLDPTPAAAVTLVTCYPFHYVGAAPKRFIVRALRVEDPAMAPAAPS